MALWGVQESRHRPNWVFRALDNGVTGELTDAIVFQAVKREALDVFRAGEILVFFDDSCDIYCSR